MKTAMFLTVIIVAGGTAFLAVVIPWMRKRESDLFNWSPPNWEHPNTKDGDQSTRRS